MATPEYATRNHADPATAPPLFPRRPEERKPSAPDRDLCRLQKQLDAILKGIKSPAAEEAVRHVFTALSRLREIMRIVEINVSEGGPPRVTLATFALAESEAKSLIRFIETRTSRVKCIKGPLRVAFCGLSFALRHELKAVFSRDLASLAAGRRPAEVRADFMRVHGLLSNCFQQSIITLARVFDKSVNGKLLFDDYRVRLEQSATLVKELSALAQLARRAEEGLDAEARDSLLAELAVFCQGTVYYLMYKDWEEFEDMAGEVAASYGSARHGFMLHCFATYLEALINQVRMRAVLNDQPPASSESKPLKKSRGGARLQKPEKRFRAVT